jgi:hypothetical protein
LVPTCERACSDRWSFDQQSTRHPADPSCTALGVASSPTKPKAEGANTLDIPRGFTVASIRVDTRRVAMSVHGGSMSCSRPATDWRTG